MTTARIQSLTITPVRMSPAEAALSITVQLSGPVENFELHYELRGKLVGPRRVGFTTIEVAYSLRTNRDNPLSLTGVIPEPNFWSVETPFRYDGTVELWQAGVKCDGKTFIVEIRASESCNPG